jgi:hypothetical protein
MTNAQWFDAGLAGAVLGSAWSVTVRGGQFGTTAHFDSNVGTVEVG